MAKAMLFIDGSWLYMNTPKLANFYGKPDFKLDFGKLPRVLAEEVAEQMGLSSGVDLVRVHLFASVPEGFDPRDQEMVDRQREFLEMLAEEFHYEVNWYPIQFRGRRLRRADREPGDNFTPQEKYVDIALATSMLYYAAMPGAYDVAIALMGDRDFVPALQYVRQLGKRVAIASIEDSCAPDLADPRDPRRVRDFDLIWMNDLLDKVELRYEPQQLECQSPIHQGDRRFWTSYRPRKGQRVYCPTCRAEYARQRPAQGEAPGTAPSPIAAAPAAPAAEVPQGRFRGLIKRVLVDRAYGFLQGPGDVDYFFHFTAFEPPVPFTDIREGVMVEFSIRTLPTESRAGSVRAVKFVSDTLPAGLPSDEELEREAALLEARLAGGNGQLAPVGPGEPETSAEAAAEADGEQPAPQPEDATEGTAEGTAEGAGADGADEAAEAPEATSQETSEATSDPASDPETEGASVTGGEASEEGTERPGE